MPSLPPFPPPPADATPTRYTIIRHPAYPDEEQPLLRLAAIDGEERRGLNHNFALTVCSILTGENWRTGYLAIKDADGRFVRIERQAQNILLESTYYYLLSTHNSSHKYPVTLSFHHYRLPHGNLPSFFWERVQIPNPPSLPTVKGRVAALIRDVTCRITAYSSPLEVAHIVPSSEEQWFISNDMTRYCPDSSDLKPTEHQKNLITLRKDQHHLFDHSRYTIIPSQDDKSTSLELRVLNRGNDAQLIPNYHTRPLQPITDISAEFLHARLAWSIFSDFIFPFFKGSADYEALVWNAKKAKCETIQLQSLEVPARIKIFESPRSRSVSPRKRKVGDADDLSSAYGSSSYSQEDNSLLSDDSSLDDGTWDDECRGRPSKRGRRESVKELNKRIDHEFMDKPLMKTR